MGVAWVVPSRCRECHSILGVPVRIAEYGLSVRQVGVASFERRDDRRAVRITFWWRPIDPTHGPVLVKRSARNGYPWSYTCQSFDDEGCWIPAYLNAGRRGIHANASYDRRNGGIEKETGWIGRFVHDADIVGYDTVVHVIHSCIVWESTPAPFDGSATDNIID